MEHRAVASTSTQVVRRGHPSSGGARRESSPQAREGGSAGAGPPSFTFRLRTKKVVKWGEDVVDNEDMGKRKSKRCCIFHKRKKFGESSSESEGNSSGAESGSESPGRQRRALCTCEDASAVSESGAAGGGPARGGAKRGPFTQRRQDQEPAAAQLQHDPWGLDESDPASSAGLGGAAETAAAVAEEHQAALMRDFLTDSAAIEQLQVENRPPQDGSGRRRSSDSGQN